MTSLFPVIGEVPSPNSPDSGNELAKTVLSRSGSSNTPSPLSKEAEQKGEEDIRNKKITIYSRVDDAQAESVENPSAASSHVIEMDRKEGSCPRPSDAQQTAVRVDLSQASLLIARRDRNYRRQFRTKLFSIATAVVFVAVGILLLSNPSKVSRFGLLTVEEVSGGILLITFVALGLLKWQARQLQRPIQEMTQAVLEEGNEKTMHECAEIGLTFNWDATLKQRNLPEVVTLLRAKYPVDCSNEDGNYLLKNAIVHPGYTSAIPLFVRAGAELSRPISTETQVRIDILFQQAVMKENLMLFNSLLKAGAAVPQANRQGLTLIHLSIKHLKLSMLRPVIEAGVDPNISDPEGNTPLHLVVELIRQNYSFGIAPIAKNKIALLIQRGAYKTERNRTGQTPSALLKEIVERAPDYSGMRNNDDIQRIAALLSTSDNAPPSEADLIER